MQREGDNATQHNRSRHNATLEPLKLDNLKGLFAFQNLPLAINAIYDKYEKAHRSGTPIPHSLDGLDPEDDFFVFPEATPRLRSGRDRGGDDVEPAMTTTPTTRVARKRKRSSSAVPNFDSVLRKKKEASMKQRERYWKEEVDDYSFCYSLNQSESLVLDPTAS